MQVISVVRDFDTYNRLVKGNPFYSARTNFVAFDNRVENQGISKRYNSFLDNYDYSKSDWFLFCHEDWELKEPLEDRLTNLDKKCLYGPIGKIADRKIDKYSGFVGMIEESKRDGSRLSFVGLDGCNLERAATFDCQCLIVHSSLVKEHHLRFDENLIFDLYVEDFCMNARERFGIPSLILQMYCHHWSPGNISEQKFLDKYAYLIEKYEPTKEWYSTTCCNIVIGK
ncbi:MAG: hypothetical protein J6P93_04900 [Alphaproteobacteria bacterium]|nr:hypothetical protein [Alphaproteobacteria bacterium]